MFDRYEKHFRDISTNISRKCSGDKKRKKKSISEMNSGLDDANDLLRKMEEESKYESANVKAKLMGKLKEYKKDFKTLKSDVLKYSSTLKSTSTSGEIFYDPEIPPQSSSSSASSDQGEKKPKEVDSLKPPIEVKKMSSIKIKVPDEQPHVHSHQVHHQVQQPQVQNQVQHQVQQPQPEQRQLEEPLILPMYEPPAYWVDPALALVTTERSTAQKCLIGIIIAIIVVALVLAILYVLYFKLYN